MSSTHACAAGRKSIEEVNIDRRALRVLRSWRIVPLRYGSIFWRCRHNVDAKVELLLFAIDGIIERIDRIDFISFKTLIQSILFRGLMSVQCQCVQSWNVLSSHTNAVCSIEANACACRINGSLARWPVRGGWKSYSVVFQATWAILYCRATESAFTFWNHFGQVPPGMQSKKSKSIQHISDYNFGKTFNNSCCIVKLRDLVLNPCETHTHVYRHSKCIKTRHYKVPLRRHLNTNFTYFTTLCTLTL